MAADKNPPNYCVRCGTNSCGRNDGGFYVCASCVTDLHGLIALDGDTLRGPRYHLHDDVDSWIYTAVESKARDGS